MASIANDLGPIAAKGWAVISRSEPFQLFEFQRRSLKSDDVLIRIHFCGICHSDIHEVESDLIESSYPMVPGHEITGIVEKIGCAVKRFQINDPVGVGCMVDSCGTCKPCQTNFEQHCQSGVSYTYNSTEMDRVTPTHGGYSNLIVVKERFVCRIPDNLPLDKAAPLLCAGTTTYSALHGNGVGKDTRVGIIGLGGLGHIAVKLAAAMGAHVTVIALSESQREDAFRLGAKQFIASSDIGNLKSIEESLNFIIDTVPVAHDVAALLRLLAFKGVYCMIGLSTTPFQVTPLDLIINRLTLYGNLIGGMQDTQDMLEFCGQHNITCDIELIESNPNTIKAAYERIRKSDVKYRFVLNMMSAFV